MPRPTSLPFESFKDFIYQSYIIQNHSVENVLRELEVQGLKCSRTTFMKKITEWQFSKNHQFSKDTAELRIKIAYLVTIRALNDQKIQRVWKSLLNKLYLNMTTNS